MAILSFIFAGIFMLTILNPPYTAILVSNSIPQSQLLLTGSLGRRLSYAHSLAQAPWESYRKRRFKSHRLAYLQSVDVGEDEEPVSLVPARPAVQDAMPTVPTIRSRLYTTALWIWSLLPSEICWLLTSILSTIPPTFLDLFTVFIWVLILRGMCCVVVNKFRVPQPASPALEFVESLRNKVHGQAFTPSTSFDSDRSSPDYSDDEHETVPEICGLATFDGAIICPKAALDTVLAVPLRLTTSSSPTFGDIDTVSAAPLLPVIAVTFDGDLQVLPESSGLSPAVTTCVVADSPIST